MTKKVPPHISRNFIYKRVWNSVHRGKNNAVFLFIGDTGTGKSTGAIKMATDLDTTFSLQRICFTLTEFFKLLDEGDDNGKLKRGNVIIFDEAAGSKDALDSRESLTATNKIASQFTTISRAKGYIIIYCTPLISQVDKRVRMIGVKGIFNFKGVDFEQKRSTANFYYNIVSGFATKEMRPKPRILDSGTSKIMQINAVTFPLPDDLQLVKAYEKKKDEFITRSITDWKKEIQAIMQKKNSSEFFEGKYNEALSIADKLKDARGNFTLGLVRLKLGIGDNAGRQILSLLRGVEVERDNV